jgi:alpha-L-fucosidase
MGATLALGHDAWASHDGRFVLTEDPRPIPQQLQWQEAELSMFLHFGMNTFTNREWGLGTEDPRLFNPTDLDADQWVHVAKEAGFKYLILTAKHHDGFCLWPSRYTDHCVRNSPWRGGKGDVVGEFAAACRRARVKMGLYVSPWDRHEPSYGTPAYNEHFIQQLTELLTGYGEVAEVWFDGANGEGPNGRKQEYDWQGFYRTIRKHQPRALIAIMGPDIRWVGNEDGLAHDTEWSVQPADPVIHGSAHGKVWWPAECDVSIRPGWFWHRSEDQQVKSLAHLWDIYTKSVGRNSVLLLNVPPNDRGLLSEPDVQRLHEFGALIRASFAHDLAQQGKISFAHPNAAASDGRERGEWVLKDFPARLELALPRPVSFNMVMTQEQIRLGQHVEEYLVEARSDGSWRTIAKGTTIGHKKLDPVERMDADGVSLTVLRSRGDAVIRHIGLYDVPGA